MHSFIGGSCVVTCSLFYARGGGRALAIDAMRGHDPGMNVQRVRWFAVSSPESNALRCVACDAEVEIAPHVDHHPAACPRCGVESAFLNWNGRVLQVVPKDAPHAFVSVLRFAQEHLDELEYVEFLCSLEEVATALNCATIRS
jgi:hypothetical protein